MSFDMQRRLAAGLPGATEEVKWETDLVHSVRGKMFCVFLMKDGHAQQVSFKVDDDRFLELTGVTGVIPAPYLARHKWIQVKAGHKLGSKGLNDLIRRSHALVISKLPKKVQQELTP